jgi:hypothetical protein
MKTRKQIIKKWEEKGYFLGTLQDAKNTFIINDGDDKYYENILSFKTNKDDIYVSFSEDVCPRYEGDFESVDFDEYKKYIKTKKWKTISKEVKERANNKCEICGSETKLVAHHHNYINIYNETHEDLLCVCNRCHETIHDGCSCFKKVELCKPCNYSKEHYQILYNFLKRKHI